jgi:hypothetical protein
MSLSPNEREKFIEEERLRFESRQALHAEACAKHPRRGRWLWWVGVAVLAYGTWTFFACGPRGFCHYGHPGCVYGMGYGAGMGPGMMGMGGRPCLHGMQGMAQPDDDSAVKPGQPVPKKP